MYTFAAFEIDVTFHETHGPYSRRIADRHGRRMVNDLRDALDHHDQYGRTYNVFGFTSKGERLELKGAQLAAIRGMSYP